MAVDVSDAQFEQAVLARSEQVPVVVDLWAPWCGPCRTLGPIIEKVVHETAGAVELVKINVDENPRASATFQVQGIPAVYALRDRQVVNGFIGAQPETVVREFVASLLPSEQENELAELTAAGDEVSLRRALELDPGHEPAIVALAELMVNDGRADEALSLLERIPESPETRRVAALARVAADGNGSGAAVLDDVETKLDALLERVKQDDDARQEFVDLLELLGADDPRTSRYRRALTAKLY